MLSVVVSGLSDMLLDSVLVEVAGSETVLRCHVCERAG